MERAPLLGTYADEVGCLVEGLAPLMPEGYFPDTYLDVDLEGVEGAALAFRLDAM